jgi:hypothetical protein
MPDNLPRPEAHMRCLHCKHPLEASGQEPYRYVCSACGQNFVAVMQLVPVEPLRPLQLPAAEEPGRAG